MFNDLVNWQDPFNACFPIKKLPTYLNTFVHRHSESDLKLGI